MDEIFCWISLLACTWLISVFLRVPSQHITNSDTSYGIRTFLSQPYRQGAGDRGWLPWSRSVSELKVWLARIQPRSLDFRAHVLAPLSHQQVIDPTVIIAGRKLLGQCHFCDFYMNCVAMQPTLQQSNIFRIWKNIFCKMLLKDNIDGAREFIKHIKSYKAQFHNNKVTQMCFNELKTPTMYIPHRPLQMCEAKPIFLWNMSVINSTVNVMSSYKLTWFSENIYYGPNVKYLCSVCSSFMTRVWLEGGMPQGRAFEVCGRIHPGLSQLLRWGEAPAQNRVVLSHITENSAHLHPSVSSKVPPAPSFPLASHSLSL